MNLTYGQIKARTEYKRTIGPTITRYEWQRAWRFARLAMKDPFDPYNVYHAGRSLAILSWAMDHLNMRDRTYRRTYKLRSNGTEVFVGKLPLP